MAKGRGNAYAAAFLLFLFGLHQASAVTYTVGGSKGWDVNIDYTSWATGLTFKVGDILFFPFREPEHNVVVVDKAGYDTCSAANAISTFSGSNTNVTLTASGAHYYLCSVPGHCTAGMRLAVTVSATAAAPKAPPPATIPTPVKAPSSAPKTPTSAPAPASRAGSPASAPSTAPTSSQTPASTPAPASSPTHTPNSSPTAPGSSPSTAGTTPSSSSLPAPNSTPSLLTSAALSPLLAFAASLFFTF